MQICADINKKNEDDEIPLYIAIKEGHYTIVKYLIKHEANKNEKTY